MTGDGSAGQSLLLMTPGPSRVPAPVLQAGARPMLHHRSLEFSRALETMLARLRLLFAADADVLPVHTTGRGAMEAAVCNLFSPGDEIAACCNGKFGEMWAGFAESYGVKVHRVCADWNRDVDPAEVESVLQKNPRVRAVTVVHCDSTTGVLNDVAEVCSLARARGVLSLVDCVCSLGGVPFEFERWCVDVAVTSSQKCLMSSPGLAFVAVSDRAWDAAEEATLPCNYWNFRAIRESLATNPPETPGTAPVHLVLQVNEALGMILREGLENVYSRHRCMSRMVLERLPGLNLSLQCPGLKGRAPTLTALSAPAGIHPGMIRESMRGRGVLLAAGIGQFRETAFRIGHLGDVRPEDVRRTLDVLEETLNELSQTGYPRRT